jgi:hypothetical protein
MVLCFFLTHSIIIQNVIPVCPEKISKILKTRIILNSMCFRKIFSTKNQQLETKFVKKLHAKVLFY